MDATENDVPKQYEVQGYPTIYFAPKNSKNNPRKYEVRLFIYIYIYILINFFQGARVVDDFIEYLAKEATEPLNGYDRDGLKKKSKKTTDDEL